MTGQCLKCATLYTWRARRGSKLADRRCACGGELEQSLWQFDSQAPAGGVVFRGRRTGALGHWPNDAVDLKSSTGGKELEGE